MVKLKKRFKIGFDPEIIHRKKILKKLSKEYIKKNVKCLNEVFNTNYRKTVVVLDQTKFSITVYSDKVLSDFMVYAIGKSYQFYSTEKEEFLREMRWQYSKINPEINDFKSRVRLYEHVEHGLLIVLDVDPKKLGFDPEIIQWTKIFNTVQKDNNFMTVIKAYIDFDIVVTSKLPLTIEDVKNIAISHRTVQGWVCEGEEAASYSEFLNVIKNTDFSKKITFYEYDNGSLTMGIE